MNLHPGTRVALARSQMTETQVAKAIAAGELSSPQQFANSWYFALRITGTGAAYREGLEEHVWRDSSIYLNQAFLDRCLGLPVILDHPPGEMLDGPEYQARNVGSIVNAWIQGDEVWGVARILDPLAAQMMQQFKLSTSPAVVFSKGGSGNETVEMDGSKLLVEANPSLLDHVAICEEGVWDKGGPPTGIESIHAKEIPMPDLVQNTEQEKNEAEADRARRDAETATGEKIDKLLSSIKVMNDRMDSMETKFADRSRRDEDPAKEFEQAKTLDQLAQEEQQSGEERMQPPIPSAIVPEADDDPLPWAEADRRDAEDDMDYSQRMDTLASTCDSAYKKRDDESMAAHCDRVARGSRRDKAKRADRARLDQVDALKDQVAKLDAKLDAKMDTVPTPEDENAMADAQARADSVYQSLGERAPRPMVGQSVIGYRILLARGLQKHSTAWKDTDLNSMARLDSKAFTNVEQMVYADAVKSANTPSNVGAGKLREIKERLPGGHNSSRFVGDPLSWMSSFMAPGRATTRLRAPKAS